MPVVEAPSIEDVRAARERIAPWAVRTPLLPLAADDAPGEIHLKLENLQPIGSFKIRGAGNALALADPARLVRGVYTASAGNMAQGVAWHARRLGVPCTAVVPDSAPEAKLAAITRLGGTFVKVPFDAWWQVMIDRRFEPLADRFFVHPFAERSVMAGNGTIGLEIMEDLPDVDTVVVPYGGGGLSVGIAAAIKSIKPDVRVFASEVDTGAPAAASFAAGRPTPVEYEPSFVDGIGGKAVLEPMWPLVQALLDGSVTCSVAEAAAAVRLLAVRNRVVAEGAGAAPVAAAFAGKAGGGKVVAVVSGGNIDAAKLAAILTGAIP
ncbi:MAG: pyridoxal-phosphate dependent enzyme [Actinobacteria bacterium]|nr:MAG: pyridoxal-phosphate dependent enzyme [Actinomycetota bacterium]